MLSLKTVVSILAVGALTALAAPTADSGTNNKMVARQSSAIVNWCQHQDWRVLNQKIGCYLSNGCSGLYLQIQQRGACSTIYAAPGVCCK